MEITCPTCLSKFRLPDAAVKPGARLRCSVCRAVFPLPDAAKENAAAPPLAGSPSEPLLSIPRPVRSKKALFFVLAILAIAAAAGGGLWWYSGGGALKAPPSAPDIPLAQKVAKLFMLNVRQYYVTNDKTGPISVIEGKVVNGFAEPKELIEIEATLYGQEKDPLLTKRQFAGTSLSLFQLQVLEEKALESFINNKLEVLANNTDIPPGGEVPFMVLFFNPPPTVAEFGVKIVDVRDPESKK